MKKKKYILESKFKQQVTRFLKAHGCETGHFMSKDWPDHLVIPRSGLPMFFVEYKRHSQNKYKLTDGQMHKIEQIKKRGKSILVLTSDMDWKAELLPYVKKMKGKIKGEEKEGETGLPISPLYDD